MPVYGTSAATFNDDGVTALYQELRDAALRQGDAGRRGRAAARRHEQSTRIATIVPAARVRYLAEISDTVRGYHEATERYAAAASRRAALESVRGELAAQPADGDAPRGVEPRLLDQAPHRRSRTRSAEPLDALARPSSSPTPATSRSCASATRRSATS